MYEFAGHFNWQGNATRFDRWNNTTYQVETVHNVYNGANQLECVDANNDTDCEIADSDTLYTYDDFGNLTAEANTTYGYDAANRLISVTQTTTSGTTETTYTYNGDGDRVSQTVDTGTGGVTTTYLLDVATPLTMVLAEKIGSTVTVMYWHGLDLLGQSDGTDEQYFQYDGLGSVRQLSDDAGAVGLSQTFDPYGNGYAKDGSAATSYGFTGEQTDPNRFVFLRARYYNPAVGRFFQTDPSRSETNPYVYGAGNPVLRIDPTGLDSGPCPMNLQWCIASLDDFVARFIPTETQIIHNHRDAFLASARRHNKLQPYMDDNAFAALIAAVILGEGRLRFPGNPNKSPFESIYSGNISEAWIHMGEDIVAYFCPISGNVLTSAGSAPDDPMQYYASVGVGNMKLKNAGDLWRGQTCGFFGDCTSVDVKLQRSGLFGIEYDLSNPFVYKVCTRGGCVSEAVDDEYTVYSNLARQLLVMDESIEYIAAFLDAGAQRAISLGVEPTGTTLAAWYTSGSITDKELDDVRKLKDGRQIAINTIKRIPEALNALNVTTTWQLDETHEPRYFEFLRFVQ